MSLITWTFNNSTLERSQIRGSQTSYFYMPPIPVQYTPCFWSRVGFSPSSVRSPIIIEFSLLTHSSSEVVAGASVLKVAKKTAHGETQISRFFFCSRLVIVCFEDTWSDRIYFCSINSSNSYLEINNYCYTVHKIYEVYPYCLPLELTRHQCGRLSTPHVGWQTSIILSITLRSTYIVYLLCIYTKYNIYIQYYVLRV